MIDSASTGGVRDLQPDLIRRSGSDEVHARMPCVADDVLTASDRVAACAVARRSFTSKQRHDELSILAEDGSALGVVAARDRAGVASTLDSGLFLDCSLRGSTVTVIDAVAGQLNFT